MTELILQSCPVALLREKISFGNDDLQTRIKKLSQEHSLFSCDVQSAKSLGGSIVNEIVEKIERLPLYKIRDTNLFPVIDVRVQRLMPGMFPSIPGWHCDNVPRSGYFSQPNFDNIPLGSKHFVCVVETEENVSQPEYIDDMVIMPEEEYRPSAVYKSLHDHIERSNYRRVRFESGDIVLMSSTTPHRATACQVRGWRMFFRLSLSHNPPIGNTRTNMNQIYLLSEANGW